MQLTWMLFSNENEIFKILKNRYSLHTMKRKDKSAVLSAMKLLNNLDVKTTSITSNMPKLQL